MVAGGRVWSNTNEMVVSESWGGMEWLVLYDMRSVTKLSFIGAKIVVRYSDPIQNI